MSLDEKTGIVYIPTGAPTYDFYGADRKGNTLFADSLLALDARTGKLIWYYQFIHHDLWDYDATSAPQLLTIRHNGQRSYGSRRSVQAGLPLRFQSSHRQTDLAD